MRLTFDWRYLAVFHFPVSVDEVAPYVPEGLVLDSMGGKPWVALVGSLVHHPKAFGLSLYGEPFVNFHIHCYVKDRQDKGILWLHTGARPAGWKFAHGRLFRSKWQKLEGKHGVSFEPGEGGAIGKVRYEAAHETGSLDIEMQSGGPIFPTLEEPVESFALDRQWCIGQGKKIAIQRPVWFCWEATQSRVDVQGDPFGVPEFAKWFQQPPVHGCLVKGSSLSLSPLK